MRHEDAFAHTRADPHASANAHAHGHGLQRRSPLPHAHGDALHNSRQRQVPDAVAHAVPEFGELRPDQNAGRDGLASALRHALPGLGMRQPDARAVPQQRQLPDRYASSIKDALRRLGQLPDPHRHAHARTMLQRGGHTQLPHAHAHTRADRLQRHYAMHADALQRHGEMRDPHAAAHVHRDGNALPERGLRADGHPMRHLRGLRDPAAHLDVDAASRRHGGSLRRQRELRHTPALPNAKHGCAKTVS